MSGRLGVAGFCPDLTFYDQYVTPQVSFLVILTTPLVKLSFRAVCDKSWNLRGCLVNTQNLNLRVLNPLSLHFCVFHFLIERERELEGVKREREKEKKIEAIVRGSSLGYRFSL